MPLVTEIFGLEETLESKRGKREELADQAAELDFDNPAFPSIAQEGNELDGHIAGLEWALDEWDVDEITLSGLTGGEYAKLENELAKDGNGPADGRLATIVYGSEEAPYVYDDEHKTYASVGQLPVAVQRWLEYEINDLTSVGGNGQTFGQLVEAKRRQADGTDNSDSSGS